jgi:hypothetical protein
MPKPLDNDILAITFGNTPLDDPDQMADAAELFRAIGLASMSWSRLEMHVDMVLLFLNQPHHSERLHDKDHPIGFKSKIKLLKRWFNQHPALKHQSGEMRQITSRLLELGQTRNTFLHSILSSFDPATKQAVWRSIKPASEATYNVGKHIGTIETLIVFAAEATTIHKKLALLGKSIFTPDAVARLRTP